MQRLVTELAALGPITESQLTESQLTNYIKNRKSKLARLAKEAAATRGAAGAAAVLGAGAAMAAGASSAASSSCGAAVHPKSALHLVIPNSRLITEMDERLQNALQTLFIFWVR